MYQVIKSRELKSRLDAGDKLHLCMVAPQWQWDKSHLPGSICIPSPAAAIEDLNPEDHIVVYCSSVDCCDSRQAALMLDEAGFENVLHFEGGLLEWEETGFPLERSE